MYSLRILHFCTDSIFIDFALRSFEKELPGKNHFYVINDEKKLSLIKSKDVICLSKKEFVSHSFVGGIKITDLIIFHSIDSYWSYSIHLKFIKRLPRKTIVLWMGWGYDYYYFIRGIKENLMLPETRKLFESENNKNLPLTVRLKNNIKRTLKETLFSKILYEVGRNEHTDNRIIKLLNRINYFAPVIKEDYDEIVKNYPDFKPKYLKWNYASAFKALIELEDLTADGSNILVGNSATPENNHLEMFELLKELDLSGRKIICPLSYGKDWYKTKISETGYSYFGKSFFPILDFVPLIEYIKLISSCSIVIMNHLRQQAAGNISIMLSLGAKVFMQETNPLYLHFKNAGFTIYNVKNLINEKNNALEKLSLEEMNKNKLLMKKRIESFNNNEDTKNLLDEITADYTKIN